MGSWLGGWRCKAPPRAERQWSWRMLPVRASGAPARLSARESSAPLPRTLTTS